MDRLDTRLAMALHAHQPIGNFPSVFRRITRESYRPFLEAFHEHGSGKIGFHASGVLYEWWENEASGMIDLIGDLVDEDRLELLSGGYYEPVLPLIPEPDRVDQLQRHLNYVEDRFGTRPRGIWLTERVWYPELPETLTRVGVEYALVDDYHFHAAGWDPEELSGYYMTESGGESLALFPISKELRYRIPFHEVDDLEQFLREQRAPVLTFADDAEKFGSWPDTREWVYEQGWLKRFLELFERGTMELTSPVTIYEQEESSGLCYLPTASYPEMLEWALPTDRQREYYRWKRDHPEDARQFGRGGHFHNFLIKYEESNRLHKRMLYLSRRTRGSDSDPARTSVLAAQCNDAYWHGVFGGLFLPHLRAGVWSRLSEAHTGLEKGGPPELRKHDFDRDGRGEIVYDAPEQFVVLDPRQGCEATVWEWFPPGRNILDTLTRRWEAYLERESRGSDSHSGNETSKAEEFHHRKTEVPSSWLETWSEDPVPRAGFQPIETEEGQNPAALQRNESVSFLLRDRSPDDLSLSGNRFEADYDGVIDSIAYRFSGGALEWRARRPDPVDEGREWGCMTTLAFRSPDPSLGELRCNGTRSSPTDRLDETTDRVVFLDRKAGWELGMGSSEPIRLVCYPVRTISRSEQDAERIYQGTAVLCLTRRSRLSLTWSRQDSETGSPQS